MPTSATVLLACVAALAAGHLCAALVQVEPPCLEVARSLLARDNCAHCCTAEGFQQNFFLGGKCRCGVPSRERVRQARALERSVNEYVCRKFSGPSYATTEEGVPLESACDRCCHQNSFRTFSFELDHSFAAPVGSAQGSGLASLGHAQCLCEGLTLKYKAPAK